MLYGMLAMFQETAVSPEWGLLGAGIGGGKDTDIAARPAVPSSPRLGPPHAALSY